MKQPNNTKTKIYSTALYMRLSRDDENFGDSVSIETQRTILQKFAAENGLRVYGEYVDDGWSGTNFDRPSFQRMMNDVEAGKVTRRFWEQRIKAEDADWGVVVQVTAGYPHSALPWALAPDEGPDDLS